MDENQTDEVESLNQPEGEETSQTSSEEMEVIKKKAALAEDYKIRAEKAERLLKTSEKEKEVKNEPLKEGFTLHDIRALQKVHDEDVDFVTKWAKTNNVSIPDAVNHKDVKLVLQGHEEERRTAAVTDTKGGRPSSNISGETLLERARQGKLPEKDEDIEKLAEARMQEKINKK